MHRLKLASMKFRKYRVLDDCARLRDIIQALPVKRHFVPSLLVVTWTETDPPELEHDFQDMVCCH
jgi:hypothetical protein